MKRLALILWRFGKADLRILWFALRHPDCPRWLRPATLLLVAYALSPFSYVIPVLGLVDDVIVVPLLLHHLIMRLPSHIRQGAIRAARIDSNSG